MNLRRLNATERKETYSKLMVYIFIAIIVVVGSLQSAIIFEDKAPEIPLGNYTCQEVYNLTMYGKLYSNDHKKDYQYDQVILYYLENCR